MHSDAFFAIGQRHDICQDYARAGFARRRPTLAADRCFALVSDGCSSTLHADLGARLLTCAALHALEVYGDRLDGEWLIGRAAAAADALAIDRACLDATLLAAWQGDDGTVHVWASGDGVVAARRRDGRIESWTIDHGGAPAYLSYLLDDDRRLRYLREGLGVRRMVWTLAGDETRLPPECGMTPWTMALDPASYDLVLVLSDGVQSFEPPGGSGPLPLAVVLSHLMDLRSTRGEFLVRRCRRFLGRFCRDQGWHHGDDFGVGGIWIDASP